MSCVSRSFRPVDTAALLLFYLYMINDMLLIRLMAGSWVDNDKLREQHRKEMQTQAIAKLIVTQSIA